MIERIRQLRESAVGEVEACTDLQALQEVRVRYLGRRSGVLTEILRSIGDLPEDQRPEVGQLAGEARRELSARLAEREETLSRAAEQGHDVLDVTLPGHPYPLGNRHPLTLVTQEIVEIFHGMGFSVAEGPEVETEYYNFDALNTPDDHPSRDMHDTFYLPEDGYILRTHTSPVQIRVMERTEPPVRVIAPGRCYRRDTVDATHHFIFHQVEGLYVDQDVTFGDLKGVISCFARQMFGEDVQVRFRPDFFPFTEPSADYSFSCVFCKGEGCRVCKHTGWIEISGSGMVDPEVFKKVGYDPERWSGYAFGMGVERIAMLKYGIDDIRLFLENDLRFLSQF